MDKIGLSRKYFMEQLIAQAEPSKTLRFYNVPYFWENELFKKKDGEEIDKQSKKVQSALEFISKNIKKDGNLSSSDFSVCFLEAFNCMFPKFLKEKNYSPIQR